MTGNVLVISPHPDDEAIGCGGTIASHVERGDAVDVLYLTSGEQGGHGAEPAEAAAAREAESRAAAAILGVRGQRYWRQPDSGLRGTRELARRLHTLIDELAPTCIYTPSANDDHRDHRAATRLVAKVLRERGTADRVEAFMYEVWTPLPVIDDIVDVTAHMGIKIEAIRAYASQCRVLRFDDAAEGLARYRGEMFLWPKDIARATYAEVFRRLR